MELGAKNLKKFQKRGLREFSANSNHVGKMHTIQRVANMLPMVYLSCFTALNSWKFSDTLWFNKFLTQDTITFFKIIKKIFTRQIGE